MCLNKCRHTKLVRRTPSVAWFRSRSPPTKPARPATHSHMLFLAFAGSAPPQRGSVPANDMFAAASTCGMSSARRPQPLNDVNRDFTAPLFHLFEPSSSFKTTFSFLYSPFCDFVRCPLSILVIYTDIRSIKPDPSSTSEYDFSQ